MNLGLAPGATLRQGTYRIERVLGQGGFGITYLATDVSLDRLVAVKEFFPKDFCDRDASTSHVTLGTTGSEELILKMKAKFLKEARNIAKLNHPGIIKIYASFEENNTAYYVMEYIDGESLSGMVKQGGPLPETKALSYIKKVGHALEYIHDNKINHLDVKPANIMVRRVDDEPILIDFGLSKQYDTNGHQTSTTPVGISHGFAPLEQYNAGGVNEFSPQTDIYSLGATLYYLLSGVVPPQATLLVDDSLTFPKNISAQMVTPISKAMAVSSKQRYETDMIV
jgi:serine/threonine protein kinase